jgi:hypothetical protein
MANRSRHGFEKKDSKPNTPGPWPALLSLRFLGGSRVLKWIGLDGR